MLQAKYSNLTEETKGQLLKWTLNKKPNENRERLLCTLFDSPDTPQLLAWFNVQDSDLSRMKEVDIDMKEADVAVTANQMERGVSNNMKVLNTPYDYIYC